MARIIGSIFLLLSSLPIFPAATNDAFSSSTLLQSDDVHSHASFSGASFEQGEPAPGGYRGSSLWWTWTPPKAASYLVEAFKQPWERNPIVAAYRGDSLTNLLALTNYAHIGLFSSKFVLRANAGEDIRLQIIDDPFSTSSVDLLIELGPLNDDFQNAVPITNSVIHGTTRGSTSEIGEVPTQNVWYTFEPPFTRPYFFELLAFSYYNDVILYEGDVRSSLTTIGTLKYGLPQAFELDATKIYSLEVRAHKGQGSSFTLNLSSGPTNDFFALRYTLSLNETNSASTFRTTREVGEPSHNLTNAQYTIWYEWTAPSSGGFYLEDPFSNYGASAADFVIYQGTALTNLALIPSHSAGRSTESGLRRATSFYATVGETYYIAFAAERELDFEFVLKASPNHDDFNNAISVPLSVETQFSGVGGTVQPGEHIIRLPRSTFWHSFTAPANGTYVVLSSFAATTYRGTSLENLIIAEPASTNLWPSAFPFRAQAGELVFISINAEYPVPYGIKIVPGKENDDFANRLPLPTSVVVSDPEWSTREPIEPLHGTNSYAGTLWWKWTAPESGLRRVGLTLPGYPVALALYTGTNVATLTPIGASTSNKDGFAFIDFIATEGTEYSIACGQLSRGFSQLKLAIQKPASHDNFDFALPLILGETITNEFLIGTLEPNEVAPPDTETLWYSWTAPSSGSFVFNTGIYVEIEVYTGSKLANLAAIPSVPAGGGVAFRATAGTEYKFQVSFQASGEVQMFQPTIDYGHPNDDLADAAELSGLFLTWTNTLSGATREEAEPEQYSRTIWARWTAPQSGEFRIATVDWYTLRLNFDVFSGNDYSTLQSIAVSNALGINFFAQAGSTYLIQVANRAPFPHLFSINLGPPVTNAQPSSATQLIGTNVSVIADNWTASTISTGKLSRVIWWRWTAPANGLATYRVSTNVTGYVYPYHTRIPTVQSNLHQLYNGGETSATTARTNSVVVTKDVSYLFRVDAAPSTNIAFNLVFNEVPANLGSFSGALLGGTNFWTAVPSAFTPGKEGLSIGPVTNANYGWIELKFVGPGRLRFKTKIQGSGRLNIATAPLQSMHDVPSQISSPHDWIQRSSMPLTYDTNVVRFIFRQTGTSGAPARAWIDDIQFVPDPPLRPVIHLYSFSADRPLQLNLEIQAGRTAAVETSTNLVDWIHWTNIYAPRTDYGYQVPIPPNDMPHFFRLRSAD